MKKIKLLSLYVFTGSLVVFFALGSVFARRAVAADLTLQITPNTTVAGTQPITVELQNTAGVTVKNYEIILAPEQTAVNKTSISITPPSGANALNQVTLETVDRTWGNISLARYDNTGGKNGNPIPLGTINLIVTSASVQPLFTVVSASAWGINAAGAEGLLNIQPGANIPPIPTATPGSGGSVPAGPTATPFPTATRGPSIPACNLCGYCLGGPVPDDYGECVQCLYDHTGSTSDPSTNQPTNPKDGVQWTVFGCMQSDAGSYTNQLVKVATAVIGGITFLIILYGGFLVLTSSGDPEKLNRGKGLVKSGIIAGVIVLFAVVILQTAGLKILQLPGF